MPKRGAGIREANTQQAAKVNRCLWRGVTKDKQQAWQTLDGFSSFLSLFGPSFRERQLSDQLKAVFRQVEAFGQFKKTRACWPEAESVTLCVCAQFEQVNRPTRNPILVQCSEGN